tara:strand:- start:605 stop:784 length:180 start_codon:yes stop_codon:yes gene_type:complete
MSKLASSKSLVVKEEKFNIKETDFLLKLMMRSQFDGVDLEVANSVLIKLSKLHQAKLES